MQHYYKMVKSSERNRKRANYTKTTQVSAANYVLVFKLETFGING